MARLTYEQKRARIRQLEDEIKEKEKELRMLIEPPEKEVTSPPNFAVTEKVLEVMRENPGRIEKSSIIPQIKEKYNVDISDQQLTSAISSLKYKKKLEIIGRAVYKLTE